MACGSCAQRRAIINQAFRREMSPQTAVKQVAQTYKTDVVKIANSVQARLGKIAPRFR